MKAPRTKSASAPAFWDTSALLLLICQQPKSQRARATQRSYPAINVWWGTRVECHSALYRLIRKGDLLAKEERQAFLSLQRLSAQWVEIQPSEEVRQVAERLLKLHSLRAADSMQLSAALIWSNHHPNGKVFICDDAKLLEAAEKEGFNVVRI
ncbi:MAG TPA: type II toxin-antitoxin system VapC family toxin [Blastocatellia bacterium]|nr:type II toxin-antitoxin system VapC family toxin [Blastocatellia bacterium]